MFLLDELLLVETLEQNKHFHSNLSQLSPAILPFTATTNESHGRCVPHPSFPWVCGVC